jgi:ATP-dependent RNA helicase RhlE
LKDIERLIKRSIEREDIEGFEPDELVPLSNSAAPRRAKKRPNTGPAKTDRRRAANEQRAHRGARQPNAGGKRKNTPGNRNRPAGSSRVKTG